MIDRLVDPPSVPSNATSVGNKCKVGFVYSFSHEKCSKVPQAFIPACTRYLSLSLTFEKHVFLIPLGGWAISPRIYCRRKEDVFIVVIYLGYMLP